MSSKVWQPCKNLFVYMDPKPTNNFVCMFKLSIVHASLSFNNNSGFKHPGVEWTDDRLGVGAPSHR